MSTENKDIFDDFGARLGDKKFEFNPDHWKKMEALLDDGDKPLFIWWRWLSGSLLALFVVIGTVLLWMNNASDRTLLASDHSNEEVIAVNQPEDVSAQNADIDNASLSPQTNQPSSDDQTLEIDNTNDSNSDDSVDQNAHSNSDNSSWNNVSQVDEQNDESNSNQGLGGSGSLSQNKTEESKQTDNSKTSTPNMNNIVDNSVSPNSNTDDSEEDQGNVAITTVGKHVEETQIDPVTNDETPGDQINQNSTASNMSNEESENNDPITTVIPPIGNNIDPLALSSETKNNSTTEGTNEPQSVDNSTTETSGSENGSNGQTNNNTASDNSSMNEPGSNGSTVDNSVQDSNEIDAAQSSNTNEPEINNNSEHSSISMDSTLPDSIEIVPEDSVQTEPTNSIEEEEDEKKERIRHNGLSLLAGAEFNQKYSSTDLSGPQGSLIDPHFGILFEKGITEKIGLRVSGSYHERSDLNLHRDFESVYYSFERRSETQRITVNHLRFARFELGADYRIFESTKLFATYAFDYLLTSRSDISNITTSTTGGVQQDNLFVQQLGYVNGFNSKGGAITLGIQQKLLKPLSLNIAYTIGMKDFTIDSYYGGNHSDKNSGLRLSLQYYIWQGTRKKLIDVKE